MWILLDKETIFSDEIMTVIYNFHRLLELGYERDVAQIINSLKSQCLDTPQTVLLSATLSEGKLINICSLKPVRGELRKGFQYQVT